MNVDTVSGRLVVVTGAGSGIGAALALEAARRGAAAVAVLDVDLTTAEQTADEIRFADTTAVGLAERCDVTDAQALGQLAEELCAEHGTPGLVCANAGVTAAGGPLLDADLGDARWVLEVNFFGVLTTLQAFGSRMAASGEPGRLLVTGSEHSLGLPHAGAGAYTASKHAVLGMCEALRAELPPHLAVSVLCPGLTASRIWESRSRRPAQFGGPAEAQPLAQQVIERGMSAEVVAARAFDGIEAGRFLIPTHYNARSYADARTAEVGEAFDRLGEIDTQSWDVTEVATAIFTELAAAEAETEAD